MVGLALVAAALVTVVRQRLPEYGLLLSVVAGVLLLLWVIETGAPLFERVQTLFETTAGAQAESAAILFKSLGICFVVQIACDACRDLGESAIAAKVEMAGKIAVLVLALPLFEQILSIVARLIG